VYRIKNGKVEGKITLKPGVDGRIILKWALGK
jgi:hypothetical protein